MFGEEKELLHTSYIEMNGPDKMSCLEVSANFVKIILTCMKQLAYISHLTTDETLHFINWEVREKFKSSGLYFDFNSIWHFFDSVQAIEEYKADLLWEYRNQIQNIPDSILEKERLLIESEEKAKKLFHGRYKIYSVSASSAFCNNLTNYRNEYFCTIPQCMQTIITWDGLDEITTEKQALYYKNLQHNIQDFLDNMPICESLHVKDEPDLYYHIIDLANAIAKFDSYRYPACDMLLELEEFAKTRKDIICKDDLIKPERPFF